VPSLFAKIFLWFWLAVVCLIAVSAGVTYTLRSSSVIEPFRISSAQLSVDAQTAAAIYEHRGRAGLSAYLNRLSRKSSVQPYVFNSRGVRIGGPKPTAYILALESAAKRRHYDPGILVGRIYRVQPAMGPSGAWYTFISEARPGKFDYKALSIRLTIIAFTATLICLTLTRHITAPIGALRETTRQIALGRFSTRVGSRVGRRHDELGSLARDFDRMAQQLESLLASQQRLLADISHELRSPLARLGVALEIARRDGVVGAPAAFDRIERESLRLNELIGELTTITRLESGVAAARAQPVDIVSLVRDIVLDADFEANSRAGRSVVITAMPSEKSPLIVNGEPELLRRAVENVIRNAVTYTGEGTAVEVALSLVRINGKAYVKFDVRDHGPGVPESAVRDIFKPFYRLDAARDRRSGGVGLGLAIVDRAISLHNGEVTAENADGGGLRITLTLPLGVKPD